MAFSEVWLRALFEAVFITVSLGGIEKSLVRFFWVGMH